MERRTRAEIVAELRAGRDVLIDGNWVCVALYGGMIDAPRVDFTCDDHQGFLRAPSLLERQPEGPADSRFYAGISCTDRLIRCRANTPQPSELSILDTM